MKKGVAFVVLLVMAFMCVYAVAEGTKEITFQGVPWFSSPDKVTKLLGESGFTNGKSFNVKKLTDKNSLSASHIAKYSKDKSVPYTYARSANEKVLTTKLLKQWQNHVQKTIAKQEVHFLNAYYTADPDKPQLVEIEMTLDNPDGDYDIKTVYKALKKAFGQPSASRIEEKEYIWLGEKSTIVILKRNYVVFATLKGLKQAEKIELNLEEPEDTGF